MRNNHIYQILLILIFFVSCGSQKDHSYNDVAGSMVVDWNVENNRVVPKIDEKSPRNNEYGPVAGENQKTDLKEEARLPMALILGPGGYRTLSYLSLLKELHLRNETPHVIIGHGLGAVMAAYYAFGYKPDYIEWKFFKFTKKARDTEIYSDEWLKLVEDVLIDDLANKKIEQGKLTLVVPVFSKKNKKVHFLKRGVLKNALMANVDLLGKGSSNFGPAFYITIANKKLIAALGVGKVMVVDLLADGINWKNGKGILNGYFQKAAQLMDGLDLPDGIVIDYPFGKYPIDDLSGAPDLLYQSKKVSKDKINEWILSKTEIEKAKN